MTYFYDGNKVIGVSMHEWVDQRLSPDFSYDFFDVGSLFDLVMNVEGHFETVYLVEDCDYIEEQVEDCWNGRGDFFNDFFTEEERRNHRSRHQFFVDEYDFEKIE